MDDDNPQINWKQKSLTWAPAEGPWRPVTEVTEGAMAPLPGTTVAPAASAILMTLASSTLFMTIDRTGRRHS